MIPHLSAFSLQLQSDGRSHNLKPRAACRLPYYNKPASPRLLGKIYAASEVLAHLAILEVWALTREVVSFL